MRETESVCVSGEKRDEKMENTDELVSIELPAPASWKKLVSSSPLFFKKKNSAVTTLED